MLARVTWCWACSMKLVVYGVTHSVRMQHIKNQVSSRSSRGESTIFNDLSAYIATPQCTQKLYPLPLGSLIPRLSPRTNDDGKLGGGWKRG